jgi:integrase
VFVSPHIGCPLNPVRYAATLRTALAKAKVEGYVRPFHDGRHSSLTNAAAAGTSPAALMARAGHSDFKTTQGYIDLAGETFRADAERLEERLRGVTEPVGYKSPVQTPALVADNGDDEDEGSA